MLYKIGMMKQERKWSRLLVDGRIGSTTAAIPLASVPVNSRRCVILAATLLTCVARRASEICLQRLRQNNPTRLSKNSAFSRVGVRFGL
jgi:hypothetical protein